MYLLDKKYWVSVRLSQDDFNFLEVLSRRWGITRSEVLRSIITENRLKEINNYDPKTNIDN